jgi:hypothetical protein
MRFSQTDIEGELADTVPNGIKRDVASRTGIYESIVYAYFNKFDERKSPQFKTLQIQWALDELNPEVGERHWQAMVRLREANKPATTLGLCVKLETAKTVTETADLVSKVIRDEPLYDQLKEAIEARDQIEKNITAILEAINKEKGEFNSPRTRLNGSADLRRQAREAVDKR